MQVVFCSRIFNMDRYDQYCNKAGHNLSISDSNFAHSFIRGIESNMKAPITLVNVTPLPSYPGYPELFVKEYEWNHTDGSYDTECGYINLPVVKQITRQIRIYKNLKKIILKSDDDIEILTYDLHVDACHAICRIKKEYPEIKTTAILPDIPDLMRAVKGVKKGSFADRYITKQMEMINAFDRYVFVTEHMKEYIADKSKPYVVIEGMLFGQMSESEYEEEINENKIVLYTGLLSKEYGLYELIEAVERLNSTSVQYELWVCGDGEVRSFIQQKATEHPYIKYYGYVDTSTIRKLQQQATVLVNPRANDAAFTRYSFPSKTISYLASGKPVIMYKLDGIPDEYDDYLTYINPVGGKIESIANAIRGLCDLAEQQRREIGKQGKEFVERNKQPEEMCKRIVNMWSK